MTRAAIAPPRRVPPALTLAGASRTVLGDVDATTGTLANWEEGVTFKPLPCGPDFVPFFPCPGVAARDIPQPDGLVVSDPFILWVGDRCHPNDRAATEQRARDLLEVDQHRQLERQFWVGDAEGAGDPAIEFTPLASDGATELAAGAPVDPIDALRDLQAALANCLGGRGMIHAPVRTVAAWYTRLRREGGVLLDLFDNVIVPGVGYPGTGPDGSGTTWAYGTGIVDTRLGTVDTVASVDARVNDHIVIAQRPAAAYWDSCCHLAIQVDLPGADLSS